MTSDNNDIFYLLSDATPAMETSSNVFDPLQISWQVKTLGSWSQVAYTTNKLYRTWKQSVAGTPLYHTVLDVACRNARGERGANTIVTKIWYGFRDRNVGNANRVAMKYWAESNEDLRIKLARQSCQGLEEMIIPGPRIVRLGGPPDPITGRPLEDDMAGVGTCTAWVRLFQYAIRAQGIPNCTQFKLIPAALFITPSSGTDPEDQRGEFLVKNWAFDPTGNAPVAAHPLWTHLSVEARDLTGVAAQGNIRNPPGHFPNHFIIGYGGEFYDPSYGHGPFSAAQWENESVAGFVNHGYNTSVVKINNPRVREMQFLPEPTPRPTPAP